ncbi:Uncharacterised protein [Klebsiella pneumoniae]|nr:Uncharacterised protein [Klebsiella pneumoniae]
MSLPWPEATGTFSRLPALICACMVASMSFIGTLPPPVSSAVASSCGRVKVRLLLSNSGMER